MGQGAAIAPHLLFRNAPFYGAFVFFGVECCGAWLKYQAIWYVTLEY
jgi:hypothetical protein